MIAPALVAALALAGCGKPILGAGKVIEGVDEDSVALNLVLIGDAGLPAPGGEPVMEALKEELSWDPERTFVVFLGDNIYPHGLPDSASAERKEAERILDGQMEPLLETGTRGIFVPGNHDWDAGSPQGWQYIIRQNRYIDERGRGRVLLVPEYGCPGPVVLDFGDYLRLIAIDSQWWLHGPAKPQGESAGPCRAKTEAEVIDSLRVDIAAAGNRHVIVVAHHPMVSGGEHGGYFDWPTYLFPFHPWARLGGFFARQDVSGREYRNLRSALERAFAPKRPLVYAAGHEHNLQILRRTPARYQIVSGAGIYNHTTRVRAITGTQYTRAASGYMRLSILRDGRVRLSVQVVDAEGDAAEDFSMWLAPEPLPGPRALPEVGAPAIPVSGAVRFVTADSAAAATARADSTAAANPPPPGAPGVVPAVRPDSAAPAPPDTGAARPRRPPTSRG